MSVGGKMRGGIKVCPEFAEIIRDSAQKTIEIRGRVSQEWVEKNREWALWDENIQREMELLRKAIESDELRGGFINECLTRVRKWSEGR